MISTSDIGSLSRQLWWWEHAEYVFAALVAIACLGEYIADFNKRQWVVAHKDGIAKRATLLLIAALALELVCFIKTNQLSGSVIGSLGQKAEDAGGKAKEAIADSLTALAQAKSAGGIASSADTKSGAAKQKADAVGKKADVIEKRLDIASTKMGHLEKRVTAQGKRAPLLVKAATAIVKEVAPFAGQGVRLFVCGQGGLQDQETIDTWGAIANVLGSDTVNGVTGAKWRIVDPNLRYAANCGAAKGLGQGQMVFVSKRAPKRVVEAATALADGLAKALPPSQNKMLGLIDPDVARLLVNSGSMSKDEPWRIVAFDEDLITVMVGAHP